MSKLSYFEIELNNKTDNNYSPGDYVKGEVVVEVKKEAMPVHGIKMIIKGKAKTHWTTGSGRYTRNFSEEDVFVDKKVYLFGYDKCFADGLKYQLDVGRHTYPFSFQLPHALPSTCEHEYGHVKYFLEVKIAKHPGFSISNILHRIDFTVNSPVNLNNPKFKAYHKGIAAKERNVNLWKEGGMAGFHFKIFKTGYVPGEVVKFYARLFNKSKRVVQSKVQLVQEMVFRSQGELKKEPITLLTIDGPKVGPHETHEWKSYDGNSNDDNEAAHLSIVQIPNTPKIYEGCRIIFVRHYLKVSMHVSYGRGLFGSTFKDCVPIIIGNISLKATLCQA